MGKVGESGCLGRYSGTACDVDEIGTGMDEKTKEIFKDFFRRDLFATVSSGIELVDVNDGYAKTKVVVKKNHLNAAGIAQGGLIFTLADYAFAVASNSHGRIALAINADITFHRPVRVGDELVAEAREISLSNKLASYLVEIRNQDNTVVATFRGLVYRKEDKIADLIGE